MVWVQISFITVHSQKGQEVLPVMTSWISPEWHVGRPGRGPAAHMTEWIQFVFLCLHFHLRLHKFSDDA